MKTTNLYFYNNISKTIVTKTFKSKKEAILRLKMENRNCKEQFCSLELFENIYK